ncbi:MAG: NAD(+) diphosphatase [Pseudomonadota bacterium]
MSPITNAPPHRYAIPEFDRAALRRKDPAWLSSARADPRSRVVLLHDLKAVVASDDQPRLWLGEAGDLGLPLADHAPLLGVLDDRAVFALSLETGHALGEQARDLRQVGPALPRLEAGLAAYARGLAYWHDTHGFCSRCGAPAAVVEAGHARRCTRCERVVFPRTDPAVIILVTHGEHCLLGRSPHFLPGMYSTLAGFVETGESLEDTIRREVQEEAGVRVVSSTYLSSQPWPFPASLMLGFHGEAASLELDIDRDELEDARWFHRDELRDPDHRPVKLPRADSIARYLVESWLQGT